jgi:hypothetical protein
MAKIDLIIGAKNAMAAGLAGAKQAIASFAKGIKNAMSGAIDIAKKTAAAIGLVGGAAIAVGKRMVEQYQIQAAAEAKLTATLEATGYTAGYTTSQLKKMAAQLQKQTGVGDEVILSMQGILATFKNVSGKEFERATVAVLDMGAAMGKAGKGSSDVESAVVQVGKALNDPIAGLTALSRVGVQFTEQQKAQIRTMQEAGNIAGAQAIILRELETQFGGTARAVADSGNGVMQLKAAYGDLQEEFGRVIMESNVFGDVIRNLTSAIENLIDSGAIDLWAEKARSALSALNPVIEKVISGFGAAKSVIQRGAAFAGAIAGGSTITEANEISKSVPADIEAENKARMDAIRAEREERKAALEAEQAERMKLRQAEEKARAAAIKDLQEENDIQMDIQRDRIRALEDEKKRKEEILRIGIAGLLEEAKAAREKEKAEEREIKKAQRLQNTKDISGRLSKKDQEWLDAWEALQKAKQEPSKNFTLAALIKEAQKELQTMQRQFGDKIRDMKPINIEVDKVVTEQAKTNRLLMDNLRAR